MSADAASATTAEAPVVPVNETPKEQPTNPLTEDFKKYAAEIMEEHHVPGLSLAVIDGDSVFSEGYGFATLPDTEATPETLYFTGSTTKAFVNALLALLIESKEYPQLAKGWKTPISSLIREDFVLPDAWATEHITLEDAAMHRSGFGRHDLSLKGANAGKKSELREQVRTMRHLSMNNEPRDVFSYCNYMYMALSLSIEAVTGKSVGDSLREHIWKPLGMNSTYFGEDEGENAPEHFAAGHKWDREACKQDVLPRDKLSFVSGAGAIISTVHDYAKWLNCLINKAKPFSEEAHKEMRRPGIIAVNMPLPGQDDVMTYGLGWMRKIYQRAAMFGHSGGCSHGAEVMWFPDLKFGVVAMANTTETSNMAGRILAYKLIDDKLAIAEKDRIPWRKMLLERAQVSQSSTDKALEQFYSDRIQPELPSQIKYSDLAGSYHHEGYGTMVFSEQEDPEKPGTQILVAQRSDTWIELEVTLRHVSAEFWIVYCKPNGTVRGDSIAFAARFESSVDGKAKSLTIDYANKLLDFDDGSIVYKRV